VAGSAFVLDLKIEIARRLLGHCVLCARLCGSNRLAGETGACELGSAAVVAEHFVHIAEEAPVNPSLAISLAGCGLKCRFCQQWRILNPKKVQGPLLDASLWGKLNLKGARSLEFVGGNPDENLYSILQFLAGAPDDFALPVVWNTHAYCSPQTLTLLEGVVDAYLPDLKFGPGACGEALAGTSGYFARAGADIRMMLRDGVCVIVRVLVMPGHLDCCNLPALKALAAMNQTNLLVSIRGQYCPDHRISEKDGDLARRPKREEVEEVRLQAKRLGLQLVDPEEEGKCGI
jgi:putative pyruvate formate lyase activating enzyme